MSQSRALILIVLLVAGCVCPEPAFGQSEASDTRQNTIHGIVVNAATHEPIGRALVYSPDNRFATLTDGEGHFEFTLPESAADSPTSFTLEGGPRQIWSVGSGGGTFLLMARKPGFLDDPMMRNRVEASSASELTISLMPEALIKGRVLLSTADAAAGVALQIFSRQVREACLSGNR